MAEFVEKLKRLISDKNPTPQNARRWKYFDRGKCFDIPNLMIFEITRVFQQFRMLSMVLKSKLCSLPLAQPSVLGHSKTSHLTFILDALLD
jgi:hypothetical protein